MPREPFLLAQLLQTITSLVCVCLLIVYDHPESIFLSSASHQAQAGLGEASKLCLLQYKICMVFNEAAGRAETMGHRQAHVCCVSHVAGRTHVSLPGGAKAEQRDRKKTCKMLENKEHVFPLWVIMCSPCLCSHPGPPQAQGNVSGPDEH